jgi:hypothetical protein
MSNELDWVSCKIAIGGDVRQVIFRGPTNPVSVPELDILAAIHGDASVTDIKPIATTESTAAEEKNRLLSKYSGALVNGIFPGRSPNMNMLAGVRPSAPPAPDKKQRATTKHTAAKPFMPPEEMHVE